jgi:hypothetical protein
LLIKEAIGRVSIYQKGTLLPTFMIKLTSIAKQNGLIENLTFLIFQTKSLPMNMA